MKNAVLGNNDGQQWRQFVGGQRSGDGTMGTALRATMHRQGNSMNEKRKRTKRLGFEEKASILARATEPSRIQILPMS